MAQCERTVGGYARAVASEVWVDRKRLDCRLAAICTVANLAGAVFVFVYLVQIAPGVRSRHGSAPDVVAFSAFAVATFALEAWRSQVSWNRTLRWLADRTPPSAVDRDAVLRLPLREAARSGVAWIVGAVYFGVFTAVVDGLGVHSLRVALTIVDGGLITCDYGKGRYVYTGISFFRELPAGVPGAYRLFANLISKRAQ